MLSNPELRTHVVALERLQHLCEEQVEVFPPVGSSQTGLGSPATGSGVVSSTPPLTVVPPAAVPKGTDPKPPATVQPEAKKVAPVAFVDDEFEEVGTKPAARPTVAPSVTPAKVPSTKAAVTKSAPATADVKKTTASKADGIRTADPAGAKGEIPADLQVFTRLTSLKQVVQEVQKRNPTASPAILTGIVVTLKDKGISPVLNKVEDIQGRLQVTLAALGIL